MRICRICKLDYEPKYNTTQPTCNSFKCMAEHAATKRIKKEANKARKEFNQKDKSYWRARVKKECHKYIRLRDFGQPCISCETLTGQMQAGHYKPGTHSITRYDTDNIHGQCSQCNEKKSGNLTEYRPRLIKKVGLDKVEWLEAQNSVRKWTIDELKAELERFKQLNRELKDDNGT